MAVQPSSRAVASRTVVTTALIGALSTAPFGCGSSRLTPPEPVQAPRPVRSPVQTHPMPRATPQATAAAALVNEGRRFLRAGRVDAALGRLERAASLDPRSGEGHYWLAQVWLAKGDAGQAREHHRLAERYLGDQPDWYTRLRTQAEAIR